MLEALRRLLPGLTRSLVVARTGATPEPAPPIERANRKRRSVLERAGQLQDTTRVL